MHKYSFIYGSKITLLRKNQALVRYLSGGRIRRYRRAGIGKAIEAEEGQREQATIKIGEAGVI